MPFRESRSRSLIKAITFRVIVVCFDLAVIFLFTKAWDKTLYLAIVSNLIRLFLYYGHERLWNRVHVGKQINIDKLQEQLATCRAELAAEKGSQDGQ